MPIQKLETTNVLKQWMDTINTIIDDSSELESRLNEKVDKETGKGLSTNDFTNTLKDKLDGIEAGANNYTLPTANNATKGGVTLSDSTSSEYGTDDGIAATPKAVKSAYDLASKALPKAGGTIEGDLTVTGKINATIEGNTDTANKLSVARTIALAGDVSGSTTFDGSNDVSITVTVADDSHNHTIENIDNLETLLALKAGTTSPTFVGTPKAPTASAGTNNTQIATTAFVQSAIDSKIATADAMIFKGTIGTNGTVTSLPAEHSTGWTYKVSTVGIYAGVNCEVGDMIVCLADGTTANDADWTVIQTNIDGAVTGPASSIEDRIAVFSGTTGKTIKDSGYTISASVPADAKFTDTTYSAENGISLTGTTFSNSGVRSVSSGTANGTISVNTNGTSADVAVKGLGSAAFTETTAYTEVAHKSVVASKDINGHVKLSDDTNSDFSVAHGVAATPAAVKSAYDLAKAALPKTGGIITGDLTVTGKINASIEGVAESAISAEKLSNARTVALTGDVTGSATFDGSEDISISVAVVDDSHNHTIDNIDNLETLLATKANISSPALTGTPTAPTASAGTNDTQIATTAFVTTAVNNAVDGAVYGPETSSVGNIAIFNDTKGNSISDSGFTIASSVPADAKFTDTTYNIGSPLEAGITKLYTETGDNTDGTINQDVLTTLFEGKLGVDETAVRATSDASGNVITTTYATKEELSNIGDSLADVATSGRYEDLIGIPSSLKNPTSLTIQNSAGTNIGSYDGSTVTTVKLDASTVGLGNVTNESKATMFTSPALTGTPTAPTASSDTNTTQIATTAFVKTAVANKSSTDASTYATKNELNNTKSEVKSYTDTEIAKLINSAPETLDTLGEIATAISENENVVEALNAAIATKANDADVVKLSGDQTINGTKTFTSVIEGSISGNSKHAEQADGLTTGRTIGISGAVNGQNTYFDGTENISILTTSIDVSTANRGVLATTYGGTGSSQGVFSILATDPFTSVEEDKPSKWKSLATGLYSFNGKYTSDQPQTYMYVQNAYATSSVVQIGYGLESASVYYRKGTTVSDLWTIGWTKLAIDSDVVHIKGQETISGEKTFTIIPKVPTASVGTNNTQIANTAFVQSVVSSNVTGPNSSVTNNVAIFDGTTGKIIKDSGFAIAKSVPSDAEFTDNSVTQTSTVDNANYPIIMKYIANNINSTEGVRYATNVTINPSTGNITASSFTGSLDGTAERATSDSIGNVIVDTYTTKSELSELEESLADVATSGRYEDLVGTPSSLKNPTILTLQNSAGTSITAYDGSEAKTVKLDASTVGLGNVTNESKATMFTSPSFTGTPTAPTATAGTNTTQIATTAFVTTAVANKTSISGNAGTATKLASAKTISLTGDVSGSASFDGSENISITATVADDSHNHTIDNIDDLETLLASKANIASPALTGTPTAPTASSTTNNTQIATTAFVQSLVDSKIAAADAMIYKGTIGTNGTVTALPNTHKTGWTYKVITAGTYAGVKCNIGDMIVCLTDGTAANNAHWTVIEGNIDGAVTGPASSVSGQIAVFDGATGKVIKDSGFTIASSVPANAKFTDTTYTGSNGITLSGTNFTNSGVRSISSGSTNGTISVNTNGTAAEVAVKGLGTAAYTASTAYAASSHTSAAATGSTLAHVKLSDATNSTSAASAGIAATPKAVKSAYDLASKALPKAGGTMTGDIKMSSYVKLDFLAENQTNTIFSHNSSKLEIQSGDMGGHIEIAGSESDGSNCPTGGVKIEARMDNKSSSLVVKPAEGVEVEGNLEVSGSIKGNFTDSITLLNNDPSLICAHSNVEKGTNPSSAEHWALNFNDKNGGGTVNNKVCSVEASVNTNGQTQASLCAYNYIANTSTPAKIAIIYPKDGSAYTYAPNPPENSNTTNIATTSWVRNRINNFVDLSSNQTIAGTKTFTENILIKNDAIAVGTNPSSIYHREIFFLDKTASTNSEHRLGVINNSIDTNGVSQMCMSAYKFDASNTDYITGTLYVNITKAGVVTSGVNGSFIANAVYNAVWNDYAEFFPRGEETEAGDFIALSLDSDNEVYVKATKETSKSVGIHSDSFGHLIGGEEAPKGEDFVEYNLPKYIPVGLVGRVRANIVGEVKKGDFIVISDIPGVGRAFNKETDSYVDIIGMACESSSEKDIKRIKVKLGN